MPQYTPFVGGGALDDREDTRRKLMPPVFESRQNWRRDKDEKVHQISQMIVMWRKAMTRTLRHLSTGAERTSAAKSRRWYT